MHAKKGLCGCGMTIAHGLAKYGLGETLMDAFTTKDKHSFFQFTFGWQNDV